MAGLLTPADPATDLVTAELRRWAFEPFDLASENCGLSVLGYAERATGRAASRVGLEGARAATEAMRTREAFIAMALGAMRELGLVETNAPVRGDVGLVEMPWITSLVAAICVGRDWAARGDREVVIGPAEMVIAWRVPCPRR